MLVLGYDKKRITIGQHGDITLTQIRERARKILAERELRSSTTPRPTFKVLRASSKVGGSIEDTERLYPPFGLLSYAVRRGCIQRSPINAMEIRLTRSPASACSPMRSCTEFVSNPPVPDSSSAETLWDYRPTLRARFL
jgi:hypothetical protein